MVVNNSPSDSTKLRFGCGGIIRSYTTWAGWLRKGTPEESDGRLLVGRTM
jgi:hypothetical protein